MKTCVWTAVALMLGVAVAFAQEAPGSMGRPYRGGPGPGRPGRPGGGPPMGKDWRDSDATQLMEMVMISRMSRQLELDDEQTVLVMRRIEGLKGKVGKLRRKRGELVKALKKGVADGVPDNEIQAPLKQLMDLDRRLAQARADLVDQCSDTLTVAQRAQFYVFLCEFETDMRKLVQRARARAAQGRPGAEKTGPGSGFPGPGRRPGPGAGFNGAARSEWPGRGPAAPDDGRPGWGPGRRRRGPRADEHEPPAPPQAWTDTDGHGETRTDTDGHRPGGTDRDGTDGRHGPRQ